MTQFPYLQRLTARLALAMLLLVALLAGLRAPLVRAAGITVNTASDSSANGDGWCSLREAIINANNDDQSGSTDCAPGSGADTITFAGNYTITLNSQLPAVTTEITITGNGVDNTIVQASTCNPVTDDNCFHSYRVFEIASNGDLTLAGLTVRNGRVFLYPHNYGGGIYNGGTLTVTNCTLSGNKADYERNGGGIYNDGTLTVTNCTLSGNKAQYGGGIYNGGTLTVTNSTLSGNLAKYRAFGGGGGIYNDFDGTVTVSNSTLSGNSAIDGGGIRNYGPLTVSNSTLSGNKAQYGGGIGNVGSLTVSNSTLSGNSANEGGGIYNVGSLTVGNSTLTANRVDTSGGGISSWGNDSTVTALTNTIVSDNIISSTEAPNDLALSSSGPITDSFTSGGHNLIGEIGPNIDAFKNESKGDQTAVNDPQLGPLTDNSGDTLTHALLPGSPAIDAGDNGACPTADQRGVIRPQGGGCDIGAVELDVFDPTVVVEKASGQADPTNASPINFMVTFNEPINTTTFTAADVNLGGTAPGTLSAVIAQIAPDDTTIFNIAVSGMTGSGTVTASIVAGTVEDLAGNSNSASTSTDNSVAYDPTGPNVVSIRRADASPTTADSVDFIVTFSEAVTGVDVGDFDLVTNGVSGAAVTRVSGSGSVYTVTVSTGSGSGDIQLTIPASATITDSADNALGSLPFNSGETYEIGMSVYLPLVLNNFVSAPDLVVDSLSATGSQVTVTISNQGNAPVVDAFWVDVYLNPTTAPTGVNQPWPDLGSQGLVWGVEGAALPLAPGQSLTLTLGDAYYWPDLSSFNTPLPTGSSVYAQVDSADAQTTFGGVLESHEISGGVYNNISGPVLSLAGGVGLAWPVTGSFAPAAGSSLPPRD